jgi:hypothetical protein
VIDLEKIENQVNKNENFVNKNFGKSKIKDIKADEPGSSSDENMKVDETGDSPTKTDTPIKPKKNVDFFAKSDSENAIEEPDNFTNFGNGQGSPFPQPNKQNIASDGFFNVDMAQPAEEPKFGDF